MTTTAIIFPGQGSQEEGMASNIYQQHESATSLLDRLDADFERDLISLVNGGASSEELQLTHNTQPSVFATGLAAYQVMEDRGVDVDYVAGHSLGHLTALVAAGGMSPADGIDLVATRGRLMRERGGHGKMVAVLLTDPEDVERICADHDQVNIAGKNSPKQSVVSGAEDAVDDVLEEIEALDQPSRFVDLDVSEAFHSPLMQPAADEFEDVLAEATFSDGLGVPVVSDTTGEVYSNPDRARELLGGQITTTIDWLQTTRRLDEEGVDRFIEMPPSGTLSRFVRDAGIDAEVTTFDEMVE